MKVMLAIFVAYFIFISPIESQSNKILKKIFNLSKNVYSIVKETKEKVDECGDWCKGVFKIQHNILLVKSIPEWGPAWKISFDLYVLSFPTPSDKWADNFENILRFTSTTNDCCSIGDRIPALFTYSNNSIYYTTNIDDDGDKATFSPYIQTGKWYSFEIEQKSNEDQWRNELTIKDDMDQEIWHLDLINTKPVAFTLVSVFAGGPFFNSSEAKMKCLNFSSGIYSYSF